MAFRCHAVVISATAIESASFDTATVGSAMTISAVVDSTVRLYFSVWQRAQIHHWAEQSWSERAGRIGAIVVGASMDAAIVGGASMLGGSMGGASTAQSERARVERALQGWNPCCMSPLQGLTAWTHTMDPMYNRPLLCSRVVCGRVGVAVRCV